MQPIFRRDILFSLTLAAACLTCPPALADGTPGDGAVYRPNLGAILCEDASVSDRLHASLAPFLDAVAHGKVDDAWIAPDDQRKHPFFVRALRGLAPREGIAPAEPVLLKAYSPGGNSYLVTVAFMRPGDAGDEIVKIIEFHAYPVTASGEPGYRFRSPFDHRCRSLRTHQVGSVRYHTDHGFEEARAEAFVAFKEQIESLVGVPSEPLDYYCFGTLDALLAAHGVVYDATKCNWLTHDLGFESDAGRSFVTGTGDERYIFEYAESFIARHCDAGECLYPPMVTGMAAYFGGYGLSGDDMPTLKAQFRDEMRRNPRLDFLDEFRKQRGSSINRHFTHFVICALITEEVIARHGFDRALALAQTGRTGDRFFETLHDTLGVDESGFHELVIRLIDA